MLGICGENQGTKTKLLLRILRIGRGSLDFAKQLVADDLPKHPPLAARDLPLCICYVCRPMATEQENICCKKRLCITSYNTLNNICLDQDILQVCIKARCDIWAVDFKCSMESFRKASYWQYALWTYRKLGWGDQCVLPVVEMICRA